MGPSYKVILSGIYYNLDKVAKLVDFIDVILTYYIGTLYGFFYLKNINLLTHGDINTCSLQSCAITEN